jgi:hypothetical protein
VDVQCTEMYVTTPAVRILLLAVELIESLNAAPMPHTGTVEQPPRRGGSQWAHSIGAAAPVLGRLVARQNLKTQHLAF